MIPPTRGFFGSRYPPLMSLATLSGAESSTLFGILFGYGPINEEVPAVRHRPTTWSVALSAAIPFAIFVGLFAQQRGESAIDVENFFTASGFMGDGEYGRRYIDLSGSDRTGPHTLPTAIRTNLDAAFRSPGIRW